VVRDRLGAVTGIVRGTVQEAIRGLRVLGRASVAIIGEYVPASVQRARGGADVAQSQPTGAALPGHRAEPPAVLPPRASQAGGDAVPLGAAVSSTGPVSADEQAPEVPPPTTPVSESSADQAGAAKQVPPGKKNKALAEKSGIGKKSVAKKAVPAKKVTAKKAAPTKKVTAKKAAPPKISPAETAAPTTLAQPPAAVDVDASRRSATPAEDPEQ